MNGSCLHLFCCCCCSVPELCPTLCTPVECSLPGSFVLYYLPEFVQIHVHWVSNAIQPSHPLLPPSPFAFSFPQDQGLFQFLWICSLHQVAKVLELQLHIITSNEYSGLISLRIYWFDFVVVQGTLKRLLQHHRLKTSFPQCSAFFMVQLLHLYMITGRTIALVMLNFVGKILSLLFNNAV